VREPGAEGQGDLANRRFVFRCGSRHELEDPGADITAVVEAELADIADADRIPILEVRGEGRRPPWSIVVTCGEGHENVFSSEIVEEAATSSPAGSVVVTGRSSTAEERYWQGVATEQAPAKQTERLGNAAGFVFANLAILGTVVTAFGLLTDVAVDRSWWLWPFVSLGAFSLIASILAQLPWAWRSAFPG
jgi:hypothetical protein